MTAAQSEQPNKIGRPLKKDPTKTYRKVSEHLGINDAKKLVRALDRAKEIGRPMTHHVTIKWAMIYPREGTPTDSNERLSRLIARMGQWLRRKQVNESPYWVRVNEGDMKRPNDPVSYSFHSHIMVHVPEEVASDFKDKMIEWLSLDGELDQTAGDYKPVQIDPIGPNPSDRENLKLYFLKEGTDQVHDYYGVPFKYRYKRTGHPVEGPRIKVSNSLNTPKKAPPP